jgi:hypothetical protein
MIEDFFLLRVKVNVIALSCPLAQQATEFITGSLLDHCYGAIVLR